MARSSYHFFKFSFVTSYLYNILVLFIFFYILKKMIKRTLDEYICNGDNSRPRESNYRGKRGLESRNKVVFYSRWWRLYRTHRLCPLNPRRTLATTFPSPSWCTFYRARLGNLARSSSGLDSDRLSMTWLITALPADRSLPAAFPSGPLPLCRTLFTPTSQSAPFAGLEYLTSRLEAHKHELIHS